MPPSPCYSSEDMISCQLTRSVQCAHQKPITVLRAAAGRVVTGSQDHTVRVSGRITQIKTMPFEPVTHQYQVWDTESMPGLNRGIDILRVSPPPILESESPRFVWNMSS